MTIDIDLTNSRIKICWNQDSRTYLFKERKGRGSKGVTWRAADRLGKDYAVKIVPKTEYKNHSIEEEIRLVRNLTARFAQIIEYGEADPSSDHASSLADAFLIVEEWIEGEHFDRFLGNDNTVIDVEQFLSLASQLCEVLAALSENELVHNDLHPENILVTRHRHGPSLSVDRNLRIVDSGSLKTVKRLTSLLDSWRAEAGTLENIESPKVDARRTQLRNWSRWFSRSDQEWVVYHLTALVNRARQFDARLGSLERQYFAEVRHLLDKMLDPDLPMRLSRAAEMHEHLSLLWTRISTTSSTKLTTPFDYISAELIRTDKRLTELFSHECPWFDKCKAVGPIYIYGPRGCGKSTILRMLSLSALLSGEAPLEAFRNAPYVGVFISCSSELRSRFWLFPEDSYREISADAILYFSTLLVEGLLETLELLQDANIQPIFGTTVGLTNDTARRICEIIFESLGIEDRLQHIGGSSWLGYARRRVASFRSDVWTRLLRSPSPGRPNPSLIFDLIKRLESVYPLLREKHIAFLIDDYSNQRIPPHLQRMLNQTISFAKQGNPIFKVTSEYQGVDLQGIQEGREVVEVNVGSEYVSLDDTLRSSFLEDVLKIRFLAAGLTERPKDLLGKSGMGPTIPMARAIRRSTEKGGEPFYYHGVDTIADICSGDLAMALDLVKQICSPYLGRSRANVIPAREQHELIRRYASREHHYLRFCHPDHGAKIAEVVHWLCWLAHEAAVQCDSIKDGKPEPMVKTGIDLRLKARSAMKREHQEVLDELIRRGILFSLDTSRTRIQNDSTERFQVRRILLARAEGPVGRRDPIKIDNEQQLLWLLDDPEQFARSQISESPRQEKLFQ